MKITRRFRGETSLVSFVNLKSRASHGFLETVAGFGVLTAQRVREDEFGFKV